MHRGYYKAWRKVTDSVSWSRGLEYRGLMHSILVRVNRKPSPFRGEMVSAGAFAVVASAWCEELEITRFKLSRMLKVLEDDEFIKTRNVHNRFMVVTVCNWKEYQSDDECKRSTTATTGAQPAHNQRTIEQEDKNKNIRERENNTGAVGPLSEDPQPQADKSDGPKRTPYKSKGRPSHRVFMACLQVFENNNGRVNEDSAWRAWCDMEDRGMLAEDLPYIREQFVMLFQQDDQWSDGFSPSFTNCIKDRAWRNKPFKRPDSGAVSPAQPGQFQAPPRATTQAQKNSQDREGMAMALLKAKEAKRNAESQQGYNSHALNGVRPELPGGNDRPGSSVGTPGRLD
ncbi:hypothetical protein SYK_02670 [Pseudodesulfovibrio nedwellii]|uniref:Uncharacterized protein n=1 Tax=Pseudodesulfovibrio nedwellii TaxID=2973072 RepID=A0ABN6RY05_9BACT|nr:hypothetical protein [Pseudodesulfovibrio nedwellii]BDQ35907.1 hypothetical protein SYK_02670 [Pseudodesulfovibrio nedwellii]